MDRLIGKEKTLPQNMKAKFQSRIERLKSVSAIIIDLLYLNFSSAYKLTGQPFAEMNEVGE